MYVALNSLSISENGIRLAKKLGALFFFIASELLAQLYLNPSLIHEKKNCTHPRNRVECYLLNSYF